MTIHFPFTGETAEGGVIKTDKQQRKTVDGETTEKKFKLPSIAGETEVGV